MTGVTSFSNWDLFQRW